MGRLHLSVALSQTVSISSTSCVLACAHICVNYVRIFAFIMLIHKSAHLHHTHVRTFSPACYYMYFTPIMHYVNAHILEELIYVSSTVLQLICPVHSLRLCLLGRLHRLCACMDFPAREKVLWASRYFVSFACTSHDEYEAYLVFVMGSTPKRIPACLLQVLFVACMPDPRMHVRDPYKIQSTYVHCELPSCEPRDKCERVASKIWGDMHI